LNRGDPAQAIERAVSRVLAFGLRTADIAADGQVPVGTKDLTNAIVVAPD
jgi:isocitrate/isopropylmalate dehydrogenase